MEKRNGKIETKPPDGKTHPRRADWKKEGRKQRRRGKKAGLPSKAPGGALQWCTQTQGAMSRGAKLLLVEPFPLLAPVT